MDPMDILLARVEAIAAELQAHRAEFAAERGARHELAERRKADAARKAKTIPRNSMDSAEFQGKPQVVKALVLKQEDQREDQEPADSAEFLGNGEHRQLVLYGTAVIERAIGGKYPFDGKKDGGIAQAMLKKWGLGDSKRAFELAAQRFAKKPFHKDNGLTYQIVAGAAQALLTTAPAATRTNAEPEWKHRGYASAEALSRAEEAAAARVQAEEAARLKKVEEYKRRANG